VGAAPGGEAAERQDRAEAVESRVSVAPRVKRAQGGGTVDWSSCSGPASAWRAHRMLRPCAMPELASFDGVNAMSIDAHHKATCPVQTPCLGAQLQQPLHRSPVRRHPLRGVDTASLEFSSARAT